MATESVTSYVLDADNVQQIKDMLLDAIKATNELRKLTRNIESAARDGLRAKHLIANCMPAPVDLDITDAADMVMLLNVLTPVAEA